MTSLTSSDLEYIKSKGIDQEQIDNQINSFKKGFPFAKVIRPATPSDGVLILDTKTQAIAIEYFEDFSEEVKIMKFVPASGAASRMFKHLFEFRESLNNEAFDSLITKPENKLSAEFFNNIEKFAFYDDLKKCYESKIGDDDTENAKTILDCLLESDGLNYANLPKALLKFHSYGEMSRLAIEEHLMEAIQYAVSDGNTARIHFTVSPEHQNHFNETLSKLVPCYEEKYGIKFEIELSNQLPSTDTIAVDLSNNAFRDKSGKLIFRPGGHGALIENLNKLDADLIFIKNIDNVVRDEKRKPTIDYKKVLGGYGLMLKDEINELIRALDLGDGIEEVVDFIKTKLSIDVTKEIKEMDRMEKLDFLYVFLNRPFRLCGMVRNDGEPGGGPFWVDKNGSASLQIVESAEIDLNNANQKEIMKQSTHFNPVDLVCFIKDYKGNNYNLKDFVDDNSAFISEKSKDGKTLKAMELPGLWNGAMAFWNTIFVEVPIETFELRMKS